MIINVAVKSGKKGPEMKNGILIIHTKARFENNQANFDVAHQVAEYFDVPISDIKLIRGRTRRSKAFLIKSLDK